MPQFDLPRPELYSYRATGEEPADLDAFWQLALGEARAVARPARRMSYYNALETEKELAAFPWSEHEISQVYAERQLADFSSAMALPGS